MDESLAGGVMPPMSEVAMPSMPIAPVAGEGTLGGGLPGGVIPTGGQMSSEEMKADLESKFEEVQNKARSLNSRKAIHGNEVTQFKGDLIRQMFKFMEQSGVDFNNLQSIRDFLTKIETENPDMAEMFESVFTSLTGGGEPAVPKEGELPPPEAGGAIPGMPPGMPPSDAGLMGKDLAQETMMPRE